MTLFDAATRAAPERSTTAFTERLRRFVSHCLDRPVSLTEYLDEQERAKIVPRLIEAVYCEVGMRVWPVEIDDHPTVLSLGRHLLDHWARWQFPTRWLARPGTPRPDTEKCRPAAFVLSTPRAGSTLLRIMLAGHPDLFCPPELHLFATETMTQRRAVERRPERNGGIETALRELLGLSEHKAHSVVAAFEQDNATTSSVFSQLVELAHPRLLVDKSPGNARYIETLTAIERTVETPRYIFLVRHPYAVIESMVRTRVAQMMDGAGELDPFWFAEHVWDFYNTNILEFLGDIEPQRYCIIRYEDLVRDPATEMHAATRTLGVSYYDAVLRPFDGNRMRDGPGDPNLSSRSTIDTSLGEIWRRIRPFRKLNRVTRQLATELGYKLLHDA